MIICFYIYQNWPCISLDMVTLDFSIKNKLVRDIGMCVMIKIRSSSVSMASFSTLLVAVIFVTALVASSPRVQSRSLPPVVADDSAGSGQVLLSVDADGYGGNSTAGIIQGLACKLASGPSKKGPGH